MIIHHPDILSTVPKKYRYADCYTITVEHHIKDSQVDRQWQDIYVLSTLQEAEERRQSLRRRYAAERERDVIRKREKGSYHEYHTVDIRMNADYIDYDGVSASVDRAEVFHDCLEWTA